MSRYYYRNTIKDFLNDDDQKIIGCLANQSEFSLENQQKYSWNIQISLLKKWLKDISGTIIFEYSIPRMGRRIDCVILYGAIIFAIEFKVGSQNYDSYAIDQVFDYALDLKNFHEKSFKQIIIPILISTKAKDQDSKLTFFDDLIAKPILTNGNSLNSIIKQIDQYQYDPIIKPDDWINSIYKPTPTIIEAAQALYNGHNVKEISRADAGAINLSKSSYAILNIIKESKQKSQKSICFLTGVPGSGKTLAGLNLANSWHNENEDEHAIFLSGNGPLVKVLQEALARNEVQNAKDNNKKQSKKQSLSKTRAFIQNIHHFRDDALNTNKAPIEKVVIFDEAQRAWTRKQTAMFMKTKKGNENFTQSEPEFLISVMNRHSDWAVIICLIGGGQEINTGEAGLHEWFESLDRSFPNWKIYVSSKLNNSEYTQGYPLYNESKANQIITNDNLHLSVSVRSYRSENVSEFVKHLLDCNSQKAEILYKGLIEKYPLYLTRNIDLAKKWLKIKARGTERFGIVASSGAMRLKPFGINVKAKIEPANWFLNNRHDIRSSYYLEDVATEFDIQGLELDWVCVAWDADLRHNENTWDFKSFKGSKWLNINNDETKLYLKNAYRVLLTRARQGMVIFIPHGTDEDFTRQSSFYDQTYNYLHHIGIRDLSEYEFSDQSKQ